MTKHDQFPQKYRARIKLDHDPWIRNQIRYRLIVLWGLAFMTECDNGHTRSKWHEEIKCGFVFVSQYDIYSVLHVTVPSDQKRLRHKLDYFLP